MPWNKDLFATRYVKAYKTCVRGNIEAILRMPQHLYRSCRFAILVLGCHLGPGNSPLSRPTHPLDNIEDWPFMKLKIEKTVNISTVYSSCNLDTSFWGVNKTISNDFHCWSSFIHHFEFDDAVQARLDAFQVGVIHGVGAGRGGGVGRLIPYMAYTGMCRWAGYGFCPLCPKQDKTGYIILRESVLNRVYNL